MDTFTTKKEGRVAFFGTTTATTAFLLKHGVRSVNKEASVDVIIESRQGTRPQMYLLGNEQLRVVGIPELEHRYAAVVDLPKSDQKKALAIIADQHPASELGELVYLAHYEDAENRAALLDSAYDAAIGTGITHASARWFAQYFVQDAFFGYGESQEFTDRGVFRGPGAFNVDAKTVKKQLKELQQAGVMNYEVLPREMGFYLRFNRQYLPGINQEKLPRFFNTFLF